MELAKKKEEVSKQYNDLIQEINKIENILRQKKSELFKKEGALTMIIELIESDKDITKPGDE